MKRAALRLRRGDWKRDLRTFALGAACGLLGGALLVLLVLWRNNLLVFPTTARAGTVAEASGDAGGAVRPSPERPLPTTGRSADSSTPTADDRAVIGPAPSSPGELRDRQLTIPVDGVGRGQLTRQFSDLRGSRRHEAIDILAPRNTPIRAVEDGTIARLFHSKAGGITVYQFDPTGSFSYYYAHLERYADGLREGQSVRRGQVLGYVGTSGNAPKDTPHLHFAIFRLAEGKRWWEGTPIDPYDVLQ
jgi:murein DD-endopeptidase MepM/ murein hydrolase activator NlpD